MTTLTLRTADADPTAARGLVGIQAQVYREALAARPLARLMPWVLDRRNLEAACDRVFSADGADTPGVDGVTASDLRRQGGAWLTRLADDLLQRRYRPLEPRWVDVPKPNKPGQTRRLGILALRDRVVLAALKNVLEPVLEPVFLPTSFGFRPGRSVPAALAEAVRRLTPGPDAPPPFGWAAHLDVASCFDTIDHRLLTAELTRHVADPALLGLVDLCLRAGGVTVSRLWWRRALGLVQGSALSPLLCNLALHPLDVACRDLADLTDGGLCVLRYADDLLLLARDARLAERGIATVRKVLGRLQQRLGNPAARAVPVEQGIDWLGVVLRPRARSWARQTQFGYVIPDPKVLDGVQPGPVGAVGQPAVARLAPGVPVRRQRGRGVPGPGRPHPGLRRRAAAAGDGGALVAAQ